MESREQDGVGEEKIRQRRRKRGGKGGKEERRNFFSLELKSMCEIRLF